MKRSISLLLLSLILVVAGGCVDEARDLFVSVDEPGGAELAIGVKAPAFELTNAVDGKKVSYKPGAGPTVLVFMSNSCPYAKAFEGRLTELSKQYAAKGVTFYSINSSSESLSSESLERMKERAAEKGFTFAYLKDGDSATARSYGARVTPHVYVIDAGGVIRYRGYVDDSAKVEERKHEGLSEALNSLLNGSTIARAETKAFGCTIKFAKKS